MADRAAASGAARYDRFAQMRRPRRTPAAGELKYLDTAVATYACSTAGSVTYISGTSTGDDANSRDGRQIDIRTVQLSGMIYPEDDTTVPCHARVMLVLDQQPNGALATIADILAAASSDAFMNLDNRDRFRVLAATDVVLGKTSTTATQAIAGAPAAAPAKLYKRVNIRSTYKGTNGDIASAATNAILLVTIGDIAAGEAATLRAGCRIRFLDS